MISVSNLSKTFRTCKALDRVSMAVSAGEMVALIGASGSGKSTLIRHMAGLVQGDKSGDGCIRIGEYAIQNKGSLASNIREARRDVGVVFQQFNLVGRLTVLQNVLLGALGRTPTWRALPGWFNKEDRELAMESLSRVGIAEKAMQRASTLSGGQQQRAAIARTLTQRAKVMLADEPIASLDPESCRTVMDALSAINRQNGITIVVSLHQVDYAIRYCPRTIALRKGQLVYDGPSSALTPSFLREIYGAASEELFAPAKPAAAEQGPKSFVPAQGMAAA